MKKVLAIVGSNSSKSINKKLTNYVLSKLDGVEGSVVDMNDLEVHLYSMDREENEGIPAKISDVLARVAEADGVILASPEHNGMPPAALKNTIDWMSRAEKKFMFDKPMLLLSTSPGGKGGKNNLERIARALPYWGGDVKATYSLGGFNSKYDNDSGVIVDDEANAELDVALNAFSSAL